MNIAGMNITYRHYPFEHFLDSMTELGVDRIELWAGEPHFYVYRGGIGRLRRIRKELRSRSMKVVCYTPNNAYIRLISRPPIQSCGRKAWITSSKMYTQRWSWTPT